MKYIERIDAWIDAGGPFQAHIEKAVNDLSIAVIGGIVLVGVLHACGIG